MDISSIARNLLCGPSGARKRVLEEACAACMQIILQTCLDLATCRRAPTIQELSRRFTEAEHVLAAWRYADKALGEGILPHVDDHKFKMRILELQRRAAVAVVIMLRTTPQWGVELDFGA